MKRRIIILLLLIVVLFIKSDHVYAENAGSAGGNNSHYGSTEGTDYKWAWKDEYNGLKITVYKKDGTVVGTKAFLNDKNEIKELNNKKSDS